MVSIAKPELLLAALKGPELACLFALQFAEGPAKVIWLGQVTGLGEHSLTQALDKLLALGLAGHDGRRSGWQLAPSLRQILLERGRGQLSLGECMADPLPAAREGSSQMDPAANRGAASDPGLPIFQRILNQARSLPRLAAQTAIRSGVSPRRSCAKSCCLPRIAVSPGYRLIANSTRERPTPRA